MAEPTFKERIDAIKDLTATFQAERITYLILTSLSALSIIGIGMYLAIAKSDYKTFLTLCVPTGTLTLCIGRIYKIWDDVMKLVRTLYPDNNGK